MQHLLIYALIDPRTDEIRYVGKSSWGMARPKRHTNPPELAKDPTHKGNWLRNLIDSGGFPIIRVLEVVESVDALIPAEIRWIAEGREQGWPLTNATPGGDGAPYGNTYASAVVHTEEWKQAASERMQNNKHAEGTTHTEEWKKATSERGRGNSYAKGWVATPEWRQKQSDRMKANRYAADRVVPDEERERRNAAVRAAYAAWTPEQRAEHSRKISEAKQGSEGNIENLRKGWEVREKAVVASADARRGVALTDEHSSRISEGLKKAYASGARKAGHSEETRAKISAAKTGADPLKGKWSLKFDACTGCGGIDRKHKGRGLCTLCFGRAKIHR